MSGGAHRDQLQDLCVCVHACLTASIIMFSANLACSRVAKVSVCPQALQALREQCLAFSHEKSQGFHEEAGGPGDDKAQVFPFVLWMFALLFGLSTVFEIPHLPLFVLHYDKVSIFFLFSRTVFLKKHLKLASKVLYNIWKTI